MDYNYLAESLAALAGVPVRIYRDGRFLSLHHTRFKPDFAITEEENIFKIAGDVGYYMDPNFLYYGLFRIRGEDIALVIGPVSPFPVSRNLARKILARMGEPVSRTQEVLDYFSVMPAYPLRNFLQILCTIQYFINGEKVSVSSFLLDEEDPPKLPVFYAPDMPAPGAFHAQHPGAGGAAAGGHEEIRGRDCGVSGVFLPELLCEGVQENTWGDSGGISEGVAH